MVKGKVTSSDGAMPGVSVQIKNTTNGVATDANGEYSIEVGSDAVLVFSFIGFLTEEVAVKGRTVIDVALVEDIQSLMDVVVIGYGTDSKKTTPSAIVSVKPDDLNRGAISDVGQLLQGKVPGLNITTSGDPNVRSAVILRGASTINGSQSPLYVIDGVVGADISIVAPDDIVSIDVLKDASATAIYGNRAANGVIIISTRRGKAGKTVTSYSSYIGFEKVSNTLDVMTSAQLRDFVSKNSMGSFTAADDLSANTDWQSQIIKSSAVSHNHNIAFSGGTDKNTYSVSLNYLSKEGILKKSSLDRVIGRFSMDQLALNDKLKFGVSVNYSNNKAESTPFRNTVLQQSVSYLPISPVKNSDGTYFENFVHTSYYNPVSMVDHGQSDTKYTTVVGAFNVQAKLPFGFTYDLNLSYQNENSLHGEFYDSYYSTNYNGGGYFIGEPPNTHFQTNFGTKGLALRNTYQTTRKIVESYITWSKEFNDHSVTAVAGYSYQDNATGDGFQATTTNLASDYIGYYNFALSNPYAITSFKSNFGNDKTYSKTKIISDFLRVNYNFRNKYLVQGSVRRDGGSVFGSDSQWGYFPSAGVAWRALEEDFFAGQNIFTDLKLRASYGVTGNALGFDPYAAQFIIGSLGTYYNNGTQVASYGTIVSPDPNLRWEKTATTNIGVDFSVLKNKVNASVELYNKNTTDMIFSFSADPMFVTTGSVTSNGGSVNNKGIELSINAVVVQNSKVSWNTTLNLAHNKNEITSLRNPNFPDQDSIRYSSPESGPGTTNQTLQIRKVGLPIGQFFTNQYVGKDENGMSQFVAADGSVTLAPSFGTDYHYLGSPQPKLLVGWANTVTYGNWSLNFFLRGVFGNKIFNVTRADLFVPGEALNRNLLVDVANELPTDTKANLYSSRFIENGSYVRMDNTTLAYNFKISNDYIKSLRLYTTVNNAFVITKYTGIDPEINQGGNALGVDSNNFYPKTRTFMLGLNVTF